MFWNKRKIPQTESNMTVFQPFEEAVKNLSVAAESLATCNSNAEVHDNDSKATRIEMLKTQLSQQAREITYLQDEIKILKKQNKELQFKIDYLNRWSSCNDDDGDYYE